MSLVPVPSEQSGSTCENCGAALVADQRYCLSCGHPASPVRLAFLDVLQGDQARSGQPGGAWLGQGDTIDMTPVGYAPVFPQQGTSGWLRRNSGLLGLLSVLLMCLIAGLLVGHWVTQSNKTPGPQIVKVEGLSGLAAAPAAATTTGASTTPAASTTPTTPTSKAAAKEEAAEAKEAAKIEKVPLKKATKVSSSKLEKLSNSSGKKHQEEINSLGAQPIETGG
jgi:hypothetical protein